MGKIKEMAGRTGHIAVLERGEVRSLFKISFYILIMGIAVSGASLGFREGVYIRGGNGVQILAPRWKPEFNF